MRETLYFSLSCKYQPNKQTQRQFLHVIVSPMHDFLKELYNPISPVCLFRCLKYKKPLCKQIVNKLISRVNTWKPYYNANRKAKLTRTAQNLPNNRQGSNVTTEFIAKNVATLQITRASAVSVTVFEQYEYPIAQLMSNLGGTMSMYLGISVISLFEIFEFFVLIGHSLCCQRRTRPV